MVYLVTFLVCLILAIACTWTVRSVANARGWIDAPRTERQVHTIAVPRLGGVAIYISFMAMVILALTIPELKRAAALVPAMKMFCLLGAGCMIFVLGLVDDLHSVSAAWKFGVQAAAAVWLYAGGFGIHNFHLIAGGHLLHWAYGLPLTVFWVLLITNAFNLIDGLDGLAAGSAFFSTMVLFVVSLVTPNPTVAFLTAALAGATMGFLRFNFHPATIFLGDSGSLFIGFMLAAVALDGSQKAPTMVAVAIPLVSLGLPILDVTLAVVRRFIAGKPLFRADRNHIHHKLLKRGFSQRDAVLILYAVSAGLGFLSLILLQGRGTIALVLAVVGIAIFLGVQQLRYQEFAELLSLLQRVTRRRQILANHVALRHAAETLRECDSFRAICRTLQETLEPIGFDAIRLRKSGKNGIASSSLLPLQNLEDGSWFFSWSGRQNSEPPWELKLELMADSVQRWGFFSLIRVSDGDALPLDLNMLTEDFRSSLSEAVSRVCGRLEALELAEAGNRKQKVHAVVAGGMSD